MESIKAIDNYIVEINQPKNFDFSDSKNSVIQMRKNFAGTCSALMEVGVVNPMKLTLFDFNTALEYHEKKNKKK